MTDRTTIRTWNETIDTFVFVFSTIWIVKRGEKKVIFEQLPFLPPGNFHRTALFITFVSGRLDFSKPIFTPDEQRIDLFSNKTIAGKLVKALLIVWTRTYMQKNCKHQFSPANFIVYLKRRCISDRRYAILMGRIIDQSSNKMSTCLPHIASLLDREIVDDKADIWEMP
jgi:hypothetical protein